MAIAACHAGFGGLTASQHPLVCRFMKDACRLLPLSRPLLSPWDLPVVLQGLEHRLLSRYRNLKLVSLKTVLLALASAKCINDFHAPSVHLKPNQAFVPKVLGSCSPTWQL